MPSKTTPSKAASNKTKPEEMSVDAYLGTVEPEPRRAEAAQLKELFDEITGLSARVWSGGIVGYGRFRYRYKSGREGEWFQTGFAPRKGGMSVYLLPGYDDLEEPLSRLGPHKMGKACLVIPRLDRVDEAVLEELVRRALGRVQADYETFDA